MKKFFIFVAVGVAILSLSACGDNNFNVSAWNAYNEIRAEVNDLIAENGDNGVRKEMGLIANTIDRDKYISIDVLYEYDGRVVSVPLIDNMRIQYMDRKNQYREYYKQYFTKAFFESLAGYDMPATGTVRGTILRWHGPKQYSVDKHTLCDLDGDGVWDYYTPGSGSFCESNCPEYPKVTINENCEISFQADNIQHFEMPEGSTFKAIEKN